MWTRTGAARRRGRLRAIPASIVGAAVLLVGCGTSGSAPSSPGAQSSTSAVPAWDIVLMGDSVWPQGDLPRRLEDELKVSLVMHDRMNPYLSTYNGNGGERSGDLLVRLRTDENLRRDLRGAEIIGFDVPTGLTLVRTVNPSMATAAEVKTCMDTAVTRYQDDVTAIFDEIVALRDPADAIIRATTVWQFLMPTFQRAGTYDVMRPRWQAMNQAVVRAAAQHHITVLPAYDTFCCPTAARPRRGRRRVGRRETPQCARYRPLRRPVHGLGPARRGGAVGATSRSHLPPPRSPTGGGVGQPVGDPGPRPPPRPVVTCPSRLRSAQARQFVQIPFAEPMVGPFLVECGAEALPHCPPLGVRGPPVVVRDRGDVREPTGCDLGQPCLDLGGLPDSYGKHLVQGRSGGRVELVLLAHDRRRAKSHGGERLGEPEHAASEPGVVHEDEVAQGLDHRPLAVDTAQFAVLGHGPDPFDGGGPLVPQSPPGLAQVLRLIGADQQSHRMTAVELRLDVGRHLDPVDHKTGDQAVDLGALHDDADHPGTAQVAFAELRSGQVLVVEASHPDSVGHTADAPRPELWGAWHLSQPQTTRCWCDRLRDQSAWVRTRESALAPIEDGFRAYVAVVDEHPIHVVDLSGEQRPPFRCAAAALWSVDNHLNLANLDGEESASAVSDAGVHRGFG